MSNEVRLKYTEIFEKTRNSKKTLIINTGGTGSSKSYSLIELFIERIFGCNKRKVLIVRKTLPALKKSTLEEFNGILDDTGLINYIYKNKSELTYEYKNRKNKIFFGSVDDPSKWKSGSYNDIWMEEAIDFSWRDYQILSLYNRAPETDGLPNQILLSCNPTDEYHWIKTRLIDVIGTNDYDLIHSTYDDNPFYPESKKKELERLKEQDANFYRIYRLGEWGRLENIIYSNWDMEWKDVSGEIIYGLDFGYNNPSALVEINIYDNEIYEKEVIYESELDIEQLIELMNEKIKNKNCPIYADPSRPDIIELIYKAGFNIQKADNSVYEGIVFCKQYKIHLHPESVNDIKETRSYSWKKDKNEKVLDEPVKFQDHIQDARRYAIYSHLKNYSDSVLVGGVGEDRGLR